MGKSPPSNGSQSRPSARFLSLFWAFFVISAVTIGGSYAIVPVMASRFTRRGWLDEQAFYDLFALAQAVPGPTTLTTAVFVGQRLLGFAGAAAAFLGIMIPPVASIILVSLLYGAVSHNPIVRGFLEGSYGTVIGLVTALLVRMLRARKWRVHEVVLALLCLAALLAFRSWALPIVIATVILVRLGALVWKS
jgi:chromate transporter